jgi:tetratricopeptide (TPR) repeat protein
MDLLLSLGEIFLLILVTRPFTVFFHELGHAVPALLFTRQKVEVYLGSYGDPENSFQLKTGLLEIWFRKSIFWKAGLCVPSSTPMSVNKNIIFTLCGPLASIIIALLGAYFVMTFDMHGSLKLFILFFLTSALLDLVQNIIPDNRPIKLHDGRTVYNDGKNLAMLFKLRKLPPDYSTAIEFYNKMDFHNAARLFEKLRAQQVDNEDIYRLAIYSHHILKEYPEALLVHEAFIKQYSLNSYDYMASGLLKYDMGRIEEGLVDYDKSLELDPSNKYSWNNKGCCFIDQKQYEQAIPLFDQAIRLDSMYPEPYNNRGHCRIQINQLEEGLADVQRAQELNPEDVNVQKNFELYKKVSGFTEI